MQLQIRLNLGGRAVGVPYWGWCIGSMRGKDRVTRTWVSKKELPEPFLSLVSHTTSIVIP